MEKGRKSCRDENNVKKCHWSNEEDLKLIAFIQKHGHDNWCALPKQAGLKRSGKSCRLRWVNYLRPDLKRGNFTEEEEQTIIRLQEAWGNKWSKIASNFPGRTDNDIKNLWYTHLKKRLATKNKQGFSICGSKLKSSITSSSSSLSESNFSNEIPNSVITTISNEFDIQASQVTMMQKFDPNLVKQMSNELIGIPKNPNESPTSLSLIESNTFNSSEIVAYKQEQQMGSPFKKVGASEVNNVLQKVDKPLILEIPFESDYDISELLDNSGSIESNPIQLSQVDGNQTLNVGQESVQDTEFWKWFHDFDNEMGLVSSVEAKKDKFQQKNNTTDPGMDPHLYDFDAMMWPNSDQELGFDQQGSSWPHKHAL